MSTPTCPVCCRPLIHVNSTMHNYEWLDRPALFCSCCWQVFHYTHYGSTILVLLPTQTSTNK